MWTALSLGVLTLAGATLFAWGVTQAVPHAPVRLVVAGALVAYFVLIALSLALYIALAWWFRSPRPPDARIGALATLRLVANEYRALAGGAWRMMMYRLLLKEPAPGPSALPVLLVHGVLCNAGVWAGFARRLDARGVRPVYTISYGPPLASIATFADQLAQRIDAILAATGAPDIVLVSHSMGGLVALAYFRKYGVGKVRRAIALGAPFHGSVHAWLFPGACLAQLRPGNVWLEGLFAATFARPPIESIWSWHDTMVAPQTSARLDGADDRALVGVGHNAILADAEAMSLVVASIEEARSAAPTSESRK